MADNRIAFGLCKKYNIHLPENASPKEAWDALRDGLAAKGIDVNKILNDLNEDRKERSKSDAMRETASKAQGDAATKKTNDKVVVPIGREKGCTYVHKDGTKEWVPDGERPKYKPNEQKTKSGSAKANNIVILPPKEYAAVCSAVRTRYANKIPDKGSVFYGNNYYRFTYNKNDEKIEYALSLPIENNEKYINWLEDNKNGRKNN